MFGFDKLFKKNLILLAYKNKNCLITCKHNYNTRYKKNINVIKTNCKKHFGLQNCSNTATELCISLNINFNKYQNTSSFKNALFKII